VERRPVQSIVIADQRIGLWKMAKSTVQTTVKGCGGMFILSPSVTGIYDMKSEIDSPKAEILKTLFSGSVSSVRTVNIKALAGDIVAGTGPFQPLSGHANPISAKSFCVA
jgi:hypothetical protein